MIFPDSQNLSIILLTADDEIPTFLAIARWQTLFSNRWAICFRSCSQSGDPHPILACERLSGKLLLYPIKTLPCFQWTCLPVECSNQVFFEHSSTFPVFCCPCPSFFGTYCWHSNSLNIVWKGFANHCILFLFTFYTTSQLNWNWGCIIIFPIVYGASEKINTVTV